jgi:hypothetical protein
MLLHTQQRRRGGGREESKQSRKKEKKRQKGGRKKQMERRQGGGLGMGTLKPPVFSFLHLLLFSFLSRVSTHGLSSSPFSLTWRWRLSVRRCLLPRHDRLRMQRATALTFQTATTTTCGALTSNTRAEKELRTRNSKQHLDFDFSNMLRKEAERTSNGNGAETAIQEGDCLSYVYHCLKEF